MLLIIDNNENIKKHFACENDFLNTSTHSLAETLEKIKKHNRVTKIYFPLELKFKDKKRQHFGGLELLKHIRLTTDLVKLQYAPILLGYTYPLETILRNPESTILCSPATHLFHLKNIQQINSSTFFHSEEQLTKDKLKPYILYTGTYEAKSEHDKRNEQGALKLERELNGTLKSDIGLDLWQKKLLFLQTETKTSEQPVSDSEFNAAIKGKRILYLDDEADKWEKPLRKLFEGADMNVIQNFNDIQDFINSILQKKQLTINEFKKRDNEVTELMPTIESMQVNLKNKQREAKKLQVDLSSKIKEVDSVREKANTIIQETRQILAEHNESIANFLLYDHDKIDTSENTVILQNFILVSNKLKLVKDNREQLQKTNSERLNLEKKVKEIQEAISNIQAELSNKKNIDLNFSAKYVSDLKKILEYDLVILDLRLNPYTDSNNPKPSGIDVLNSIKQFNPNIPVLLFTSSQNPKTLELAESLNADAYWIKNVSHLNDLKLKTLNILFETKAHDIYWKSELICSKANLEKYFVSDFGNTVEKKPLSQEDRRVLFNSLNYFVRFLKSKSLSETDFWTNTGKLSEARFISATNRQGNPEQDRPKLIERLNLSDDEKDFNSKRNKSGAHIGRTSENIKLCENYIDRSVNWFLNYLPNKE
jgi:CheY-like chemotaxis protein